MSPGWDGRVAIGSSLDDVGPAEHVIGRGRDVANKLGQALLVQAVTVSAMCNCDDNMAMSWWRGTVPGGSARSRNRQGREHGGEQEVNGAELHDCFLVSVALVEFLVSTCWWSGERWVSTKAGNVSTVELENFESWTSIWTPFITL